MNNPTQKTTLYRYFDCDGQLLYVGITGNNLKRQSQHRRSAEWLDLAATATFQHYDDRASAEEAEKSAIRLECPVYNIQYNRPSKDPFDLTESFAKYHLLSILSGRALDGSDVKIDDQHKQYKKSLNAFDLSNDVFSWDECLVMELEYLVWLDIQGDVAVPNLDSCELCNAIFACKWYGDTLIAIDRKTIKGMKEALNAAG